MKLKDFDYHLPGELIAQHPCDVRDGSRMMVIKRKQELVECKIFQDLPEYFKKDDVLVVNDSKVIPARLIGKKKTGGTIEMLLLSRQRGHGEPVQTWEVLLRPAKMVSVGTRIFFDGKCEAHLVEQLSDKKWAVEFQTSIGFDHFLEEFGRAPLPPYINRKKDNKTSLEDIDRYQTIYARHPGSVAAPTAGLHFSQNILDMLKKIGVHVVPVTLHVGYGTFLPIDADIVEKHVMEEEFFEITKEAAAAINKADRVIAAGTTSIRVIESVADAVGKVKPLSGQTGLFIHPGYRFKRVSALITNFHLPRSSLFLLVCAFAGKDLVMKAYNQAIENRFRFYSYGDCMLIL